MVEHPTNPRYAVSFVVVPDDAGRLAAFRTLAAKLEPDVIVTAFGGTWQVVGDCGRPGRLIDAALEAGRVQQVNLGESGHGRPRQLTAAVACAAGPGIASHFVRAGATSVASEPGHRADADAILEAARGTGAADVVVLPNTRATLVAAEIAAAAGRVEGLHMAVVRSRTAVQGIAALSAFDERAPLADNVVAMTAAAARTRPGAVTISDRTALTMAGMCHPGDALGVVGADIAVVGESLDDVAADVVTRLVAGGADLLTVIRGSAATDALAARAVEAAKAIAPAIEVVELDGGQTSYPLLFGVE